MLYIVSLRGILGPDMGVRTEPYAEKPWFEEQRLRRHSDFPVEQIPVGGKTVIKEQTIITGSVKREDSQRGIIEIIIDPNGKALGRWSCAYEYPQSSYTITAGFAGNIDPTKIYQDESGKNRRFLYLITKGKYKQVKTDTGTGAQWPEEETIYVIGWIDNDYSARGKLFLMAGDDEETYGNAEYDWHTEAADLENADNNK
ncbi:MAG: hypothetical protein JW806_00195 [Sedimentisphaerales bacterium]|nr:hypothetical protein [Sedimentisphaerales bacterium]